MFSPETITFFFKWQTLVGAATGPFLAVIFSGVSYVVAQFFKRRREYKEFLRQVEISTAESLNDIFDARDQLNYIISAINGILSKEQASTNHAGFFISKVSFPPIREVYQDRELTRFKAKSYYLHNKILRVIAGAKDTNNSTLTFKSSYEGLIRDNWNLIALMVAEKKAGSVSVQRAIHIEGNKAFIESVKEYIEEGIPIPLTASYEYRPRPHACSYLR